jgi:hypothetical protein
MTFDDLLAPVLGESGIDDALESWRWLTSNPVNLLLATAFGDAFVRDDFQRVWFLDIISGTFEPVASSVASWNEQLRELEFVERYFMADFVTQFREAGLILTQGECYVPKLEPILGGSWSIDNWSPGCWSFHLERQGRVHFAVKDVPDGTVITKWNYTEL